MWESGGSRFFARRMAETPPGASLHGFSVAFGRPYWRLSCRFSCSPLFFELSCDSEASRGPIVAFSDSQGRKRCSRPLVAFSAAELLFDSFLPTFGLLSLPSSLRNLEKPAKVSFPRLDGY